MSVRAELFSIRGLNPGASDRTPATFAIGPGTSLAAGQQYVWN